MKRAEGRKPRVESQGPILSFRNRQHTRALDIPLLRRMASHILECELDVSDYELGLHFVGPAEMAQINGQFLQHESSTDVITFDHGSSATRLHGEIFICVADAVKQAAEFKTSWQSEVVRYVIHGLLHLCGFDDLQPDKRRAMKREENCLVGSMESRFPVRKLARVRNSKRKAQTSR